MQQSSRLRKAGHIEGYIILRLGNFCDYYHDLKLHNVPSGPALSLNWIQQSWKKPGNPSMHQLEPQEGESLGVGDTI